MPLATKKNKSSHNKPLPKKKKNAPHPIVLIHSILMHFANVDGCIVPAHQIG
jgi:hypothetical protein